MRRLCILLAVASCNQFYGLEGTEVITDDRDGDGLLDVIDNCADIANPLQENRDGDALGDICDPCPQGSNHNEDGDAWLDGCDNCPQIANDDQANGDGDDLGDACDLDPRAQRRVLFDGFETLQVTWVPGEADWIAEADAVHPVTPPLPGDPGMWNRRAEAGGASYFIEMAVHVDDTDGTYAGMWTRQKIGANEHQCYITRQNGSWVLAVANQFLGVGASQAIGTLPSNPFVLRLRRNGTQMHCELGSARVTIDIADPVTFPDLFTSAATTQFLSIDIVTSDP